MKKSILFFIGIISFTLLNCSDSKTETKKLVNDKSKQENLVHEAKKINSNKLLVTNNVIKNVTSSKVNSDIKISEYEPKSMRPPAPGRAVGPFNRAPPD